MLGGLTTFMGNSVGEAAHWASLVPAVGRNQEVAVRKVLYEGEGRPWDPSQDQEVVLRPLLVQHQGESFHLQAKSKTRMI